jgi:isopenicillin N synthase-like dioxygenase
VKKPTFDIPTIDLESWWDGSPTERAELAAVFDDAASSVGFMQIAGHRIPDRIIDSMVAASTAFFDKPLNEKMEVRPDDIATNRGYAYAAERHRLFAPNVWPDSSPELRPALVAYFAEARRVALALTDVFAIALGLDAGWFRPFVDRSTTTMRVINYENRADSRSRPAGLGMGSHTDYGVVTVLWSDGKPGLEILGPDGAWQPAAAEAGNVLVNFGDMTAEWTNDRWRSTLHRVLPPATVGVSRRKSTAFFFDANWDALIECVPTCTGPDNPPRYPPVRAGEHLLAKLMGPRELRPSDALNTAETRRPTE